jgi:hypothetical protein
MPAQDAPPSVVRTIEVHGWTAHGAVPRTQPSLADTKVIDTGSNPGGTGPPAAAADPAWEAAGDAGAAAGLRAAAGALTRGRGLAAGARGAEGAAEQPATSAVAQTAAAATAKPRARIRPGFGRAGAGRMSGAKKAGRCMTSPLR